MPKISRRTALQSAGSAVATVAIAGCTSDDGQTEAEDDREDSEGMSEDDTVTVIQGPAPEQLDPQNHTQTYTSNVVLAAYENLLFRDEDGQLYGELVEEWERIEEGRVRLTLREDVPFHDGSTLTPEDAAFSLNRILLEEVGDLVSPQNFEPIQEAEPIDDEFAIDVISESLNPIVFQTLGSHNGQIMKKSWVEERDQADIAMEMNGTGPFKLVEFEQDEYVRYERFEEYREGPADIESLEYRGASEASTRVNQLLAGESDLTVNIPPDDVSRVEENEGTSVDAVAALRMPFFAMVKTREPFDSVEFRRAMNLAVDNESIIENVLDGFGAPSNQPTQEGVFGYNPDVDTYPQDYDRAEELVEESGYAGVEITLHTPTGRYLRDVEVAQAVASQIDELPNVSASVEQRDTNSLFSELSPNLDTGPACYMLGYANAIADAAYVIEPLLTEGGSSTSWEDEETQALFEEAQSESDIDRREELLQELNQEFHDLAPWIFLHQQANLYGTSDRFEWTARGDDHIDPYTFSVE
ncbi:ABC transporter substrate-binding protein [Halorubrum trueperi]|uniref:ABC transporter substrate-binding protein n=1 Tax=Halorubrum trueperi TaxID=2004704 RepID=A0ABD5ULP9_9EURY